MMSQEEKEQIRKKLIRQKMKEDGAFDGRFQEKTFKDPSHYKKKYKCREKIDPNEYDKADDFSDIELFEFIEEEEDEIEEEVELSEWTEDWDSSNDINVEDK